MAIKRKNEAKNKNTEINSEVTIKDQDTIILDSETAVPSKDRLLESVLKNILVEKEDNNSHFNESVRVFDYSGSDSVPSGSDSVPMVFFVDDGTADPEDRVIPLAYSPYNNIFKHHKDIMENDDALLNAIKMGMSLNQEKMSEGNKIKLSNICESRYNERRTYLSQMWRFRTKDIASKLAIKFISHLYMNVNCSDININIDSRQVVGIICQHLYGMVYECNGSCNDIGAHKNSEKINNGDEYVDAVLDNMYSSIKTPETINMIMTQLYTLVEQIVVDYLSGCCGHAIYNYEDMTKENEERKVRDRDNKFGSRYEIDFSNDGMYKSGISIDELYTLIINRTLPVFESFREDLILAIIQLRYEVSVMFKNLSFGTNDKEDIKQIIEYNKPQQIIDENDPNNPAIYYTSF